MFANKGVSLRFLLSVLVIISVLLTVMVSVYSASQASKNALVSSYLVNNSHYAKKLSSSTNELLNSMIKSMELLAKQVNNHSEEELHEDLHDFMDTRKNLFNSVLIVDDNLRIRAVSPASAGVAVGAQLSSDASKKAIALKGPFISEPYRGISGRLIILISVPIFDQAGLYRGFVGGTIYIEEPNVLNRILQDHFYQNGSYVYVVDKSGHLIFHPDKNRLGEDVSSNDIVQHVLSGKSGTQQVDNSEGKSFLAAYEYESLSGWGIISQTPSSVVNQPKKDLVVNMLKQALPFFVLILVLAWFVSTRISKPLHLLAKFSEQFSFQWGKNDVQLPYLKSGIYEVQQLHRSIQIALLQMKSHINELNIEMQKDGLTGLANRKTFDLVMNEWTHSQTPFSLMLLDIDFFKRVNDTYGHVKGDEVIKYLAQMMRNYSRQGDLCFRYGGEEFGILVPFSDQETVVSLAERLRTKIENTNSPTGHPITVSIGIAVYPEHGRTDEDLLRRADEALYRSKNEGRNRTTVYAA